MPLLPSVSRLRSRVPSPRFSAPLPGELIDELSTIGRIRRVPSKTIVAREGESSDAFCVVKRGVLRVLLSGTDGRTVVLGEITDGEYFGEAMIDGGSRIASIASRDRCELICISPRQFFELLSRHPAFAREILFKMTGMLRSMSHFIKRLALLEVDERVKLLLADLAREQEGQWIIRPRPTQQAIADRVGASRSMIHRVMKGLIAEGFVVAHPHELVIRL